MDANYETYLQSMYPGSTWTTRKLTGGIVNSTLRATKTSGPDTVPSSLVIKHARPYIESAGPDVFFSTKRQAVEAAVLRLWDEGGALFPFREQYPKWDTPHLVRHDTGKDKDLHLGTSDMEASIIILSDLGQLQNIVQFLTDLQNTDDSLQLASSLGQSIGSIMAIVHSHAVHQTIQNSECNSILTHSLTTELVWRIAVKPVIDRVQSASDPQTLYNRVVKDYQAPKYDYVHALSFGDFHPGSVLLRKECNDRTPILVDWEFAQVNGRGVNGDMAQFLASLHLDLIKAKDDSHLYARFKTFALSLCTGYQVSSKQVAKQDATDPAVQLLRSAFILHGREMVNLAFEENQQHPKFREMVDMGIWYLEAAGDNANAFVQPFNWQRLQNEDLRLIQILFGQPS